MILAIFSNKSTTPLQQTQQMAQTFLGNHSQQPANAKTRIAQHRLPANKPR
jgi:hypothetical protein